MPASPPFELREHRRRDGKSGRAGGRGLGSAIEQWLPDTHSHWPLELQQLWLHWQDLDRTGSVNNPSWKWEGLTRSPPSLALRIYIHLIVDGGGGDVFFSGVVTGKVPTLLETSLTCAHRAKPNETHWEPPPTTMKYKGGRDEEGDWWEWNWG